MLPALLAVASSLVVAEEKPIDPDESRAPISAEATASIEEFLQLHDRLVQEGNLVELRELYADDFYAPDLGDYSPEEILQHWNRLHRHFRSFQLRSLPRRIVHLGEYYSVCCCRPLVAELAGRPVEEDLCQTLILRLDGSRLEIVGIHEIDHEKLQWLKDDRVAYAPEPLGYRLRYPGEFFAIPHQTHGGELDHVRFVKPSLHAELSLSLMDPTLPMSLEESVREDLGELEGFRRSWVHPPRPVDAVQDQLTGWDGYFATARYDSITGPASSVFGHCQTSSLYLTRDGRLLFALHLQAPVDSYEACREELWRLARSIEITVPEAERVSRLFAENPDFARMVGERYVPGGGAVALRVAETFHATPLAGRDIDRLRLTSPEDAGTQLLFLAFPLAYRTSEGALVGAAERRVDRLARSRDQELLRRAENQIVVAGEMATSVRLTYRSGAEERTYCIVGFDCGEFHYQIRLYPASDATETQERLLAAVAAGLVPQ